MIIESTYDCLISSFMRNDPDEVYVGMVKYFDHENQPVETILQPSTHRPNEKRLEKELRDVTMNNGRESNIADIFTLPPMTDRCKEIQVSLRKLIKKVYVSPEYNESMRDSVKQVINDNVGNVFSGIFP